MAGSGTGAPGDPRTYTISTDTLNGVVALGDLLREIEADGGITTAIINNHLERTGDTLSIFFVSALSAGELTALDAVVAAHDGVAATIDFQYWEDNPASTTTQETFQEIMSRTTAKMRAGTYIAIWYFELRINPTGPINSKAMAQFKIGGNIKGSTASSDGEWIACSGWDRIIVTEGEQVTLSLELQRDPSVGGNDTVEMRKKKLGLRIED